MSRRQKSDRQAYEDRQDEAGLNPFLRTIALVCYAAAIITTKFKTWKTNRQK